MGHTLTRGFSLGGDLSQQTQWRWTWGLSQGQGGRGKPGWVCRKLCLVSSDDQENHLISTAYQIEFPGTGQPISWHFYGLGANSISDELLVCIYLGWKFV